MKKESYKLLWGKPCRKCGEIRNDSVYNFWCSKCRGEAWKIWNDKNKQKRREYAKKRLDEKPWLKTLNNIRSRLIGVNKLRRKNLSYTKRGIKNELSKEDLKFLWLRDKAHEMERPSIDRINSFKNYTIENCRYIELTQNIRNSHARN